MIVEFGDNLVLQPISTSSGCLKLVYGPHTAHYTPGFQGQCNNVSNYNENLASVYSTKGFCLCQWARVSVCEEERVEVVGKTVAPSTGMSLNQFADLNLWHEMSEPQREEERILFGDSQFFDPNGFSIGIPDIPDRLALVNGSRVG